LRTGSTAAVDIHTLRFGNVVVIHVIAVALQLPIRDVAVIQIDKLHTHEENWLFFLLLHLVLALPVNDVQSNVIVLDYSYI
jgi:hypothetical protein